MRISNIILLISSIILLIKIPNSWPIRRKPNYTLGLAGWHSAALNKAAAGRAFGRSPITVSVYLKKN